MQVLKQLHLLLRLNYRKKLCLQTCSQRAALLNEEQAHLQNLDGMFITGSSNLTRAGLSGQEEFNVEIKDLFAGYLKASNSIMSIRDYLSYIWTVTYGASLLLNSTHYQKSIGSRERLIKLYVNQALMTPDKISTHN